MTPAHHQIPEDIFETPTSNGESGDRPSGSWPRRVQETLDAMGRDLHEIKRALVGTMAEDGMATRVRSLEKWRKWVVAMGIALASIVGKTVWDIITTGKANP